MIAKAKAGMRNLIIIAVMLILLLGISNWAKQNPAEWQVAVDKIAGTITKVVPEVVAALGNLIVWVLDQIAAATAAG